MDRKFKTQLCNNFQKGRCFKGDTCNYAHSEAELRGGGQMGYNQRPMNYPPPNTGNYMDRQPGGGPSMSNMGQQRLGQNRKTVKCRYWEQGRCTQGDNCPYLHEGDGMSNQNQYRGGNDQLQRGYSQYEEPQRSEEQIFTNVDEGYVQQLQLNDMIEALQNFYSGNQAMLSKLKQAKDLTDFGDYDSASDILTSIMFSGTTSFKDRERFQHIIAQAVANALDYIETQSIGGNQNQPAPRNDVRPKPQPTNDRMINENSFAAPGQQYHEDSNLTANFGASGKNSGPMAFNENSMGGGGNSQKNYLNKPAMYF